MKNLLDVLPKKKITSADVIKAFRKNFKVSQVELAKGTGLTQGNISSYETKGRNLGLDNALKIAIFFGIDPLSLLYPNGIENEVENYKKIRKYS